MSCRSASGDGRDALAQQPTQPQPSAQYIIRPRRSSPHIYLLRGNKIHELAVSNDSDVSIY